MKVLMINSVCGIKSTGRICTDLAAELEKRGHTVRIAYGRDEVPAQFAHLSFKIGNKWGTYAHGCYARVFDAAGFGSKKATRDFIHWVEDFDPDVIHLHNIHGYYVNVQILFDYLRRSNKRIVWTLHDCWAFTGHCCYFDYADCAKWKEQCCNCPQKQDYPASVLLDRSKENYIKKKELFSGLADMTLVTPSRWLASLVHESFLHDYPVRVIPNWVNTNTFSNTPEDFRKQYNIKKKYVVLGVASVWDRRKGLDVFLKLNELLGGEYQIVLVGLTAKQQRALPESIIGISHTSSVRELTEIYSAADVFVNPTHEDNYPATNLESIACGTPVISFDTGGSGESASLYGAVVPENNLEKLIEEIHKVAEGAAQLSVPDLDAINSSSFENYFRLLEGRH